MNVEQTEPIQNTNEIQVEIQPVTEVPVKESKSEPQKPELSPEGIILQELDLKKAFIKKILITLAIVITVSLFASACKCSYEVGMRLSISSQTDLQINNLNLQNQANSPNIWITPKITEKVQERRLTNNQWQLTPFDEFKKDPKLYINHVNDNIRDKRLRMRHERGRNAKVTLINGGDQSLREMSNEKPISKVQSSRSSFYSKLAMRRNKRKAEKMSAPQGHAAENGPMLNFAKMKPWKLNMGYRQMSKITFQPTVKSNRILKHTEGLKV